ncbi:MAG TPA: hypothetical protein VFC18_03860 [Burkholderiales bacterium]|nr:hypothetical protein [Burkholderiales bacterium]
MSALCLAGDGATASLFAAALHLGWTDAQGVAREESWHVRDGRFEFFAQRVLKEGEWRHAWPHRPSRREITLERENLVTDYIVCGEGWCTPLEKLLPRSRAPVVRISTC